mgnify:CR=1 FL=1
MYIFYKIDTPLSSLNKSTQHTMNENYNDAQITATSNALISMRTVPEKQRDNRFQKMVKDMECYIDGQCNHNWVHDLVDIDPDRSKSIIYCTLCFITKK